MSSRQAPAASRRAFAKVNLALSVGAPLPPTSPHPGYHPIASWFAAIELADDVELLRLSPGGPIPPAADRLDLAWAPDAPLATPIDWPAAKDLSVRALEAVERRIGRGLPVGLRVRKRIPVGGGLGGGSSDAAAVLHMLRDLVELSLSPPDWTSLAAALGADVPFFLDATPPAPAVVTGLGERLDRLAFGPARLLLAIPPFGCPTPAVYRAYDAALTRDARGPRREPDERRVRDLAALQLNPESDLFNDLEAPACVVEPRLAGVLARLRALTPSGRWHLTGSGAASFHIPGPGQDPAALAAALTAALAREFPGLRVVPTALAAPA